MVLKNSFIKTKYKIDILQNLDPSYLPYLSSSLNESNI